LASPAYLFFIMVWYLGHQVVLAFGRGPIIDAFALSLHILWSTDRTVGVACKLIILLSLVAGPLGC